MVDFELFAIRDKLVKKYGRKFKFVERCAEGGIYAVNTEGKIKIIKPCSGAHTIKEEDIWKDDQK